VDTEIPLVNPLEELAQILMSGLTILLQAADFKAMLAIVMAGKVTQAR